MHVLDGDVEGGGARNVKVVFRRHRDAVGLPLLVVEPGAERDPNPTRLGMDLERRGGGEARDCEGVAERIVLRIDRLHPPDDRVAERVLGDGESRMRLRANRGLRNVGAVFGIGTRHDVLVGGLTVGVRRRRTGRPATYTGGSQLGSSLTVDRLSPGSRQFSSSRHGSLTRETCDTVPPVNSHPVISESREADN